MTKILCVTHRPICQGDFLCQVEAVAKARPDALLLREKDLTSGDYASLARAVLKICRRYDLPLILHNFPEVALALGASALHLPLDVLQRLSPEERASFRVLGASCHSVEDVKRATELGCTYLTVGHIFATDCKKGLPGRGLAFLRQACLATPLPVYAIGGITPENRAAVEEAGAAGIALMSAPMTWDDPAQGLALFRS